MVIDVLKSKLLLAKPWRLRPPSSWEEHIPFLFFLMEETRPRLAVELGTYSGNSFFAICQAVLTLGLQTRCYAVDTWKGDDHVGFYEEDIFADVCEYNNRLYSGFSHLMRMTFDEAVEHFSDGTIDLLHMDGYSGYESSKHDLEKWLAKMNSRGIILIHDIHVRKPTVGVWRVWEEIREQFPAFEFTHQYGLGVIAVGSELPPGAVEKIFGADDSTAAAIRGLFQSLGERNSLEIKGEQLDRILRSNSWRLTRPLRDAKSSMRGLWRSLVRCGRSG